MTQTLTQPADELLFVGTYSTPGPYFEANGSGLCTLVLDPATGKLSERSVFKQGVNISFLDKMVGKPFIYACSDQYFEPGLIESYSIDPDDGSLSRHSTESVIGTGACHISLNSTGTQAYVCSYHDATLTVHDIANGKVSEAKHTFTYEGSSVNQERQQEAHAHQAVVAPGDRWLYAADLGSDKIWVHDLENLDAAPTSCTTPAGAGTRHMVCHPKLPLIYLICELDARLVIFQRDIDTGALESIGERTTLPEDADIAPAASAIRLHPSLKTLCVSNRTHDSIAFMPLDENGLPSGIQHIPSHGKDPRDIIFNAAGTWMIVTNQYSDNVASFKINPVSGLPESDEPSCTLACGSPVTVVFY